MSETNVELLPNDSTINSNETIDDEARRKKILSKMWGKGNKSSHKVRELEKTSSTNSIDSPGATEENSNSINMNKPLAVVKPIILVKSDLVGEDSTMEDNHLNDPPMATTTTITTTTVNEPTSTSTTNHRNDDREEKNKKKKDSSSLRRDEDKNKSRRDDSRYRRSTSREKVSSRSDRSKFTENSSSQRTRRNSKNERRSSTSTTSKSISNVENRPKERINDDKTQNSSSSRRSSDNSKKIEKPKILSPKRHRSTSRERKSHRKPIESSRISIDRRSPSPYERKSNSRHRLSSSYSTTHHHHHDHHRSNSSRHDYSRSRYYHRSRYNSSHSSSSSVTPRHRHRTRSSSSSSSSSRRSTSSFSSISRTSSSSRSRSRTEHFYNQKKFRRSPTLEKLFLKASESIESVSTQKNPNTSSSTTHLVPIPPSTQTSDLQISPSINVLSTETNSFYGNSFSGFSAPPPPFHSVPPPQQRFLKEITTDSSTTRRSILNEVQIPLPILPPAATTTKSTRTSRFSDFVPSTTTNSESTTSSVDIPVETDLNYIQISENIYCLPSSRRQQKRHNREVIECECTTSEEERSRGIRACGSECLNRMLLIECGPMCPCGQWCTNRRFQRRSYANHKLVLFKTNEKGLGIRTTGFIRKGRFLVEYIGEVIDMDELTRRSKKYKRDGLVHQYVMSLIHGTVIDSTIKGNWARFINHSCEPNCSAEKWLVNGEYRMGFFAKRDLNPGEEITIDYRFETFGTNDLINEKCYCGASTCRGTISLKNNSATNETNKTSTTTKRTNRRSTMDDDDLLVYLRDENTNEYLIPKTIDEIRQFIQIMSRTDSENIRTIELDLIKQSSTKQFELPRLFLECNGLHVLSSWMKDILIDNEQNQIEQQYSNEFQLNLLDFMHQILPIKDRTTVVKHGLLDLIKNKIQLVTDETKTFENDEEIINDLFDSMLNHLDNPIITKLFQLYSRWSSLKERFIIPKRKEAQNSSDHHHHHHHHHRHSSKTSSEETNSRYNYNSRSSTSFSKSIERSSGRRTFSIRDFPKNNEQQLSKDERRRLFEQQYEDEERARAAGIIMNQNEPPMKKQRTSDGGESNTNNISPQSQDQLKIDPQSMDHMYWMHQQLSQIPLEYIRTYLTSMDPSSLIVTDSTLKKDEDNIPPPPPKPDHDIESTRIIRLPTGWAVTMCLSDSSVYFYNRETMTSSWTPPSIGLEVTTTTSGEISKNGSGPLDLSPLSSAHIIDHQHHRSHSQSARVSTKSSKHSHRHTRLHRHHHHHHHNSHLTTSSIHLINKRKRVSDPESNTTTTIKDESHRLLTEDLPVTTTTTQLNEIVAKETDHEKPTHLHSDELPVSDSNVLTNDHHEAEMLSTVKNASDGLTTNDDKTSLEHPTSSSSSSNKENRDLLRKHISQHVHTTLKPYTKRTCKQGRIVSTDDIKYLVKKFTLAVLDKEIEKAKNDGIALSPILTDRVRLKTEVYVRKYMHKMGPVFHRHDTTSNRPTSSDHPAAQSVTIAETETETELETTLTMPPASSSTIVAETNDNSMNAE